ncbi:MAG: hypothetical protein M3M99_01700 [Actinomycetota bacterium]|nr:hypothetical protein [Actinomycetota bacterium]
MLRREPRYPTIARYRRRRFTRAATLLSAAAIMAGVLLVAGAVLGAFNSTNANTNNSIGAAADFVAPTASRSVIGKTQGGTPGFIRQGGSYFVYGDVTDSGNPASGVSTVSSNTSTITTGATATALAAGAFSAGGLSYNRRTASVTANGSLTAGTYNYTLSSTDVAGNARTENGFSVVVDNTAPAAADIQTANVNTIVGRPQITDTITFTFSEPVEPGTVLSGWDGSATAVVVRMTNGLILLGDDGFEIFNAADSAQLPLGTVDLGRGDYIGGLLGGEVARFGATGTSSSMVLSGNSITITLGTASGQGAITAGGNGTMSWDPVTTPTDRAGNSMNGAAVNESGGADREF